VACMSWSVPCEPADPAFIGIVRREEEEAPEQNPYHSCVTGMWSRIQPNVPTAVFSDLLYAPVMESDSRRERSRARKWLRQTVYNETR
jgi:hypothetical protein